MIPIISVVMSVYNGEPYLREAIESILSQTFNDFEFIIINDGSSDDSLKIIKEYYDARVVVIDQENIGLTRSLNKGVSLSKGKYIARMDADDVSFPYRFEKQLPWLEDKDYDLCCSRTWLIEQNRVTPRIKYYLPKRWLLKFSNPFIHGTYLMKKTVLDKIGGYDESFRYAQDYKLITDIYDYGFKVKYLKEPLYKTRNHSNSIGTLHGNEQRDLSNRLRWL